MLCMHRVDELQEQEGAVRAAMEAAGNEKHKVLQFHILHEKIRFYHAFVKHIFPCYLGRHSGCL